MISGVERADIAGSRCSFCMSWLIVMSMFLASPFASYPPYGVTLYGRHSKNAIRIDAIFAKLPLRSTFVTSAIKGSPFIRAMLFKMTKKLRGLSSWRLLATDSIMALARVGTLCERASGSQSHRLLCGFRSDARDL